MRADPEQFWDSLQGAGGVKHHAAAFVVGEPGSQVIEQVRWALHADQVEDLEAAGDELGSQLAGPGPDRPRAARPWQAA